MSEQQIKDLDKEIERQETIIMLRYARNMLEAMFSVYFPNFDRSKYLGEIDNHLKKMTSKDNS